jgi:uncharacterized protein (TIGR02678 family)
VSSPTPQEERQMALLDLLDRALIRREEEPEAFARIRRHEAYLRTWFDEHPQWPILSAPDLYRLQRTPSRLLPERGLPRLTSPLAYACLCWSLLYREEQLGRGITWFTLGDLAERVREVADGAFQLAQRPHRLALVQALRLLQAFGVIQLRDGDEDDWAQERSVGGEAPNALYDWRESAPRLVANFTWSALERADQPARSGMTLPPSGEEAEPRVRAWRALLLGPLFWRGDDPEAFALLQTEAGRFAGEVETALGATLGLHREWAALWRQRTARGEAGRLIDLYPPQGLELESWTTRYVNHPLLLLCGALQAEVTSGALRPDEHGAVQLSRGALLELLRPLRREYRSAWGSELKALDLEGLADRILAEGRRIGLFRGPDLHGRIWALPAAAGVRGFYPEGALAHESTASPNEGE